MFKRLLVSALFAGFATGLIAAALLQLFVTPVLLEAELYETGELVHFGGASQGAALEHDHDSHEHLEGEGGDRALMNLGASIATNIGYALVLVALMAFSERYNHQITPRVGLLWGLAGFVAVQMMPALGHPPELPGNAAADLSARQLWWALTVLASALGVACLAFGKTWAIWGAGIAALVLPQIIGAPHPDTLTGPTPPEIAGLFASRSLGINLVIWSVLGLLAAYFWSSEDNVWVGEAR